MKSTELKQYNEADILAIRWINKEGKTFWAVEVQLSEYEGGETIYLRAKNLISGKHYRNIGRLLLKAAGYEVYDNYSHFLEYGDICGNFLNGTKREALSHIKSAWYYRFGEKRKVRNKIIKLDLKI